jgi:hypothetical protein
LGDWENGRLEVGSWNVEIGIWNLEFGNLSMPK